MGPVPESTAPTGAASASRTVGAGLLAIAVAAALARKSDGSYLISPVLAAALQLPACAVGWFGLVAPGRLGRPAQTVGDKGHRWIGGLALVGVLVVAIAERSIDAALVGWVAWLAVARFAENLSRVAGALDADTGNPMDCLRAVFAPWLVMVLLATALLATPLATQPGIPDYRHNFWLHVSHSAGAAISAGCLVGTSVYQFGEDYTRFGQIVIVIVTQLSGMAFAGIGLAAIRPMLHRPPRIATVWLCAVFMQIAAIAVVYGAWHETDANRAAQRLWWGVVHVGSAIWNGGWVIRADGLARYLHDGRVFLVMTMLSVVGSLGLPIIFDLLRASARRAADQGDSARRPLAPLPVWDAGLALALLVGVAALVFVWESPQLSPAAIAPDRPVDFGEGRLSIRDDMPTGQRWSMAVFLSATLRSAGIQSMPMSEGAVSWPTYALMLAVIWLGGSIAGTAGGLRTSTVVLLVICLCGRRGGNPTNGIIDGRVRRTLGRSIAGYCAFWIIVQLSAVGLFWLFSDATAYEKIFEPVAALGNVGLSTGASLHLTPAGRILIILLTIVGRWLPAYFWMRFVRVALAPPAAPDGQRHPSAGR